MDRTDDGTALAGAMLKLGNPVLRRTMGAAAHRFDLRSIGQSCADRGYLSPHTGRARTETSARGVIAQLRFADSSDQYRTSVEIAQSFQSLRICMKDGATFSHWRWWKIAVPSSITAEAAEMIVR